MNPFGYSENVWALFREAPRAGTLAKGAVVARATSNASQAVLELQAQVQEGRILEAKFRAFGCPTTIAVGAWLAETLSGSDATAAAEIDAARIREALDIPEARAHCALLGEDAVRALQGKMAV